MELADLKRRWDGLMHRSGISVDSGNKHFSDVCSAYSEPHRHYHTLAHIGQILNWLEEAGMEEVAGLWAAWYHDYVYIPGKRNNELRSAEVAESVMADLGLDRSLILRTKRIIEATSNHTASVTDDALILVLDADMAILGVSQEFYRDYSEKVKKEYSNVPDFLYWRGRKKFLEKVMQSPIYTSEWFSQRFEVAAKNNVKLELKMLDQ